MYEKKAFQLKGKNIEELKKIDLREFAKLIKSRERRTILRNFASMERTVQDWLKKSEKNKQIKTHLRDMVVVPQLVGLDIFVYNGKEYVKVSITGETIGHRLGEFALSKKVVKHGAPGLGATKSSASASVK
jgi:small subunit ribosomal protein S19